MIENCYGKPITAIKAFGVDEFDFSRNILGVDFSVGQFGYVDFAFGEEHIYISIDGISSIVPPKKDVHEIPVHENIHNAFVGAVLEKIIFDGDRWKIYFKGFDVLYGRYESNDGMTDRSYFDLMFPFF